MRRRPVRRVHAGDADGGRRPRRPLPVPDRRRGARRPRRRPVPVHRLHRDPRGGPRRGRRDARRGRGARRGPRGRRPDRPHGRRREGHRAPSASATTSTTTGVLLLRAVRSPHDHARFTVGDLAPLHERHPGLVRVLAAADVPGDNLFGIYATGKDQPVLADGYVRFRGEAVLALVGDPATILAIRDDEVPIAWEPLPALLGHRRGARPAAPSAPRGLARQHPRRRASCGWPTPTPPWRPPP